MTSVHGNVRIVTYDGEVGTSGIKVNGGQRYYFDAIAKIEKI